MAKGVTEKQMAVLKLIGDYRDQHQISPSVAEIADHMQISKAAAHDHLLALKKKGFLSHSRGIGRSWRIIPAACSPRKPKQVPLVGKVAAGVPILAKENIEGWISVDRDRDGETLFALRVKGDSMIEAGILEGDIVVIRRQQTASVGEIVVALVDDEEAVVKRLTKLGPRVSLKSENPLVASLDLNAERVQIQGKVVGLSRTLD